MKMTHWQALKVTAPDRVAEVLRDGGLCPDLMLRADEAAKQRCPGPNGMKANLISMEEMCRRCVLEWLQELAEGGWPG